MCGIIGYIGAKEAIPILVEGLRKLEYRGYDSAGIATIENNKINIDKCAGKIENLEKLVCDKSSKSTVGIGHTRWATHGKPSFENSHPQTDCTGRIAVVHNGIIENYITLKKQLIVEGHTFKSDTDTEVIAHMVEKYIHLGIEKAMTEVLNHIEGSYAIGVISEKEPHKIIAARKGSPLIIGIGDNEYFIASDIPALLKYTSKIIKLGDGEIASIERFGLKITNQSGQVQKREPTYVSWDPVSAEKSGYAHFMLKEIFEQPRAIEDTIAGRINKKTGEVFFEEINVSDEDLKKVNRVVFTACGTSWHASLIGEYLLEQYAQIPSEVEYAAEFRYRHPLIDKNTLVIAISQSGETADTLGAVWEAQSRGAKVISICNVVDSSIARESHGVIYTHAGPEIGVASTKAFTTQLVVLYLFAIYFGRIRGTLSQNECSKMIENLLELPTKAEEFLKRESSVIEVAEKFYDKTNALYLGRGKGFPIALEGALKLKEVSYIHAEGYPAAEMKHGPIALIDKNMPVIIIALKGRRYEKILGNIEEVKARGGIVIAIAIDGDDEIKERSDEIIFIPQTTEALSPIIAVIPLQLLAYHIAVKRGCHVDQPKNLAKSVTVE